MFEIRMRIEKWQECSKCGGSGCDACEGKGKTYLGEGAPIELVEYWHEKFPEVFGPTPSEEDLNKVRKIFEAARNIQKES